VKIGVADAAEKSWSLGSRRAIVVEANGDVALETE